MYTTYSSFVDFVRELFPNKDFIPLHEPLFCGNEKKYVNETIDSTFVSSVGPFVDRFEHEFAQVVGANYAVATVNGTAALHIALKLGGVKPHNEVITQPLTFVATCNAITYCQAHPVFIDVDPDTLGLSADRLRDFLTGNTIIKNEQCINKYTGNIISACLPMHTFGFPAKIDEIAQICAEFNITLIEDAAEALGSIYKGQHVGTFGKLGVFSFNGNKIITTGGGGMIVTNDPVLAKEAKHLTTTAKLTHSWKYEHNEVGYNYRLPNINAALGCAQLEKLPEFLTAKNLLSRKYADFFRGSEVTYLSAPDHSSSNFWLNGILLKDKAARDEFLAYTNKNGVMTRPVWELMNDLLMYQACFKTELDVAKNFSERLVNVPSSVGSIL